MAWSLRPSLEDLLWPEKRPAPPTPEEVVKRIFEALPPKPPRSPRDMSNDLIERGRAKAIDLLEHRHATAGWLMQELADALAAQAVEIEQLRNLFKIDGEQHAQHIKDLTARHEARTLKYLDKVTAERVRADALAARVAELEAALRQIEGWEPATQEVTLAHQMADLARAALQGAASAGEGGGS